GDDVIGEVVDGDLGASASVVGHVAAQTAHVVEATPHALVHLHHAHGTDARGDRPDGLPLAHELTPAALLPRGSGDEPAVDGVVLRVEAAAGEGLVGGLPQ